MEIMQFGVMQTPALVINEKVVLSGRLPNDKELKKFINTIINNQYENKNQHCNINHIFIIVDKFWPVSAN